MKYGKRTVTKRWKWSAGGKEERKTCHKQVLRYIRLKYSERRKIKKATGKTERESLCPDNRL